MTRRDQHHRDQPSLFGEAMDVILADNVKIVDDCGEVTERARASDPQTSHMAAESIAPHIAEQCQEALDLIRQYPDRTGCELDQLAGKEDREISKRIGDLKNDELIIVTGRRISTAKKKVKKGSKRLCETYRVADQ